jgi:hypothetical protein
MSPAITTTTFAAAAAAALQILDGVVSDSFIRNWLDLLSFLLSGLPANGTIAAEVAFMVSTMHQAHTLQCNAAAFWAVSCTVTCAYRDLLACMRSPSLRAAVLVQVL